LIGFIFPILLAASGFDFDGIDCGGFEFYLRDGAVFFSGFQFQEILIDPFEMRFRNLQKV